MRKILFVPLLALLLGTQVATANSLKPPLNQPHPASLSSSPLIFPHFTEFPGSGVDLTVNAAYTAGLAGMPDGTWAALDLYLFDQATNQPLKSATNNEVCNPCLYDLSTAARTATIRIEDEILARGGFPSSAIVDGINGFGIIFIRGDVDAVSLHITQKQMQANFDLPLTLSANGPQTFPHFVESSGSGTDVLVYSTYTGNLAGIVGSGGAELDLYLYNETTGAPLKSAANMDVCNPCLFSLSETERSATISVEDLITANGGFPGNQVNGFGIIVIRGADPANVSLQVVQRLPFASFFLPLIVR
jgi:hypothetical protein